MRRENKADPLASGFFRQQKDMSVGSNIEALGRAIWQTSGDIRVANEVRENLSA